MPEETKPKNDPQPPPVPPLPLLEEPDIDREAVVEQAAQALAKQPGTIRDLLQGKKFKEALQSVLPRAMRAERFARVALTTMMRVPDLAECSRESFFQALLNLSSYGLEPDGRRAHLIPFRNRKMCQCGHEMDAHKGNECSKCDCRQRRTMVECQLIIDYKGLVELVRRSGDVSYIHADVVYAGDEWSCSYGTEAHLKHTPNMKDRGTEKVAFYSYVRLKDGAEDFMVMSPAEVEKIRKRSKAADSGPWVTDYDEMGKKTAFRRHTKWLPLSAEVRDVIAKDDADPIDVSGWEEVLDPAKPEAPPAVAAPPSLKDRMMPGRGPQPKLEAGQ